MYLWDFLFGNAIKPKVKRSTEEHNVMFDFNKGGVGTPAFKFLCIFLVFKMSKIEMVTKCFAVFTVVFCYCRGNQNELFKATVNPKRPGTYDVTSLKSQKVHHRRRTGHLGCQGCGETCGTNADLARKKRQVTYTTKRDYSIHI